MRRLYSCKNLSHWSEVSAGAQPLPQGQSCIHSKPQSSGRTTRLLSTDVSRVSQSCIHCAYRVRISDYEYSNRIMISSGREQRRAIIRLQAFIFTAECDIRHRVYFNGGTILALGDIIFL